MKKLNILVLFACITALCLALAGCGDSGNAPEPSNDQASTTESTPAEPTGETTITAADLASVDITIEYGDFDAMSELAANIQSGRNDDSVVQIDGNIVNYGTSCSIVEPSADGSKRIGTVFVIEGASENAYPQDGAHVKLTGIVGADDTGYTHFIKTLPEFVEAIG